MASSDHGRARIRSTAHDLVPVGFAGAVAGLVVALIVGAGTSGVLLNEAGDRDVRAAAPIPDRAAVSMSQSAVRRAPAAPPEVDPAETESAGGNASVSERSRAADRGRASVESVAFSVNLVPSSSTAGITSAFGSLARIAPSDPSVTPRLSVDTSAALVASDEVVRPAASSSAEPAKAVKGVKAMEPAKPGKPAKRGKPATSVVRTAAGSIVDGAGIRPNNKDDARNNKDDARNNKDDGRGKERD